MDGPARKLDRIDAPHVAPLNRLVRTWREAEPSRFVPWFDPDDGGTGARIAVLLERPAPSTVRDGAEAFCSEDNSSASSAALRRARDSSGLPRGGYVKWNAVPWTTPDARRPSGAADVDEAREALHEFLRTLPELRVLVPLGAVALTAVMRYFTLADAPVIVPVLAAPHPSPANGAHRAEQHLRMVNAFTRAAAIAGV